ncbi:THO complex subunitTHOC2 C-terminal [Trinorchestia longiramus]|nr:THO complex subunitTHOC2 C-terminal [Trinorchestia longiramus]
MMFQARSLSSALHRGVKAHRGVSMSVVEVWLTPSTQRSSCWTFLAAGGQAETNNGGYGYRTQVFPQSKRSAGFNMAVVYRKFSADTWKLWDKTGKNDVVSTVETALHCKDPSLAIGLLEDVNRALYEVVWAVVQGHLKKEQAKPVLLQFIALHPDMCSQVVEVLAMVELEITSYEGFSKMRDGLIKLMQILGLERMYRERLELETLSDVGIVKNKKLFHTKQIKVRTKMFYKEQKFNLLHEDCLYRPNVIHVSLVSATNSRSSTFYMRTASIVQMLFTCLWFQLQTAEVQLATRELHLSSKCYFRVSGFSYKQQKFNLLREECEGYAKLVTELNQSLDHNITPQTMITVIRSLIGCFNLDPNRVLDLILEAMECRPAEHNFYTSLLKLFPCQSVTLTELFRFRMMACTTLAMQKPVFTSMALLVQAGVLSLEETYAWLTPHDSKLLEESRLAEEAAHEYARKANVISTKDKDKEKEKKEEKEDHKDRDLFLDHKPNNNLKIPFSVALLEIGDWQHFEELSSRFPDYYLTSFPTVSNALAKLCHVSLEPCYRSLYSLPVRAGGRPVPPLHNPYALPTCHSPDEVAHTLLPIVCFFGPHIARHPSLMVKLLRVARCVFTKMVSYGLSSSDFLLLCCAWEISFQNSRKDLGWRFGLTVKILSILLPLNLFLHFNLPALVVFYSLPSSLSLAPSFSLSRSLSQPFSLPLSAFLAPSLSLSRSLLILHLPPLVFNFIAFSPLATLNIIVRPPYSRTKLPSDTSTLLVVKQIQLYDNLISPVVDSLKYLTSLSFDVLAFCIVETLTANKERLINAGMAVSPWLNSLSAFCGAVYKKYPIELCGVLQFIANQLKAERSVDLLLLQEILQKMGGTDTSEGLTAEQIEAMSGGEVLRREAGTYQQERNTKRSSQRLKEVLLQHNLAIPLLLLIAQQRSCIVYNQTESPHLKLVGKLYDQCQETLAQFGAYLFQVISLEEVSERLPSIGSLLSECHINSDVAFFLARPTVSAKILARFDEMRRSNRSEDRKQLYIDASTEVLMPLSEEIRPHFPSKLWEEMHPSFFVTFWTLNLSDLEVPSGSYKREVARFNDNIAQLHKAPKDEPAALASKRKKELERVTSLRDKLLEEENKQHEHVDRVIARLTQEKERWFTQRVACLPKNDTVTAFLQLCLFPRCTFTTLDALYCARFVKMMHELKTPNFSTLIFCDRMFCDITYTVASCTEQEAHRYGQFLHGALQMVMHWHASSDNYERECAKFPGFVTRFRVSKMESNDYVDYENYRHVVHKWHFKITKALVTCLESGDYIQIRNAILVLQSILSCFPAIVNLANVIDKRIEKVKRDEKNNRNDLYVLANSYSGRLRAKKSKLLQEKDFHQVRKPDEKRPPQQGGGEPVTNGVESKATTEEDKKGDSGSSNKDSARLGENNEQSETDARRKDSKRNKADADEDDVKEVGGDSDEATNDSDSVRKSKRQKTDSTGKVSMSSTAQADRCYVHGRSEPSECNREVETASSLRPSGDPCLGRLKYCSQRSLLTNNKDDVQPRHKQPPQDSPNRRKKERKRERSVDEAVDGDTKRQRSDRRSNNGRVVTQEEEVALVETEREEKKRSSRRRKET